MTPEQTTNLVDIEVISQPSLTYGLDLVNKKIRNKIDNADAMMQAIKKILLTERYSCVIYDGEYGIELERFIGKDRDFVMADVKRVLEEALMVDDRVVSISDLKLTPLAGNEVECSFVVNTVFGNIAMSTEVRVQ